MESAWGCGCAVAGALLVVYAALGVLVAVGPAGARVGLTWLVSEPGEQDTEMKLDSGDVEIPASSVSVYEAIFRRRNVKELTGEAVFGSIADDGFPMNPDWLRLKGVGIDIGSST